VSVPAVALAVTVEGKNFEQTMAVEGETLKLVGAGLREKGWIDVYALGAYTESGSCNRNKIIKAEEVKYLRFEMLRNVKGSKMASTIGAAFDDAIPPGADPQLKSQRETFKGYFKDTVKENQVMEFIYVPNAGVTITQDGKQLGPRLTGKPFQEVLWSIYFGSKTCCEDLRDQILESCE
jgi:hypothetical protein